MKKILMLLAIMLFTECSYAFYTGNDLAKWMVEYEKSVNDNLDSAFMAGQNAGYVDGISDSTSGIIWCNPGNVTNGQVSKIVSKYLHNNPEKLHLYAYSLVTQALKEALPCKK